MFYNFIYQLHITVLISSMSIALYARWILDQEEMLVSSIASLSVFIYVFNTLGLFNLHNDRKEAFDENQVASGILNRDNCNNIALPPIGVLVKWYSPFSKETVIGSHFGCGYINGNIQQCLEIDGDVFSEWSPYERPEEELTYEYFIERDEYPEKGLEVQWCNPERDFVVRGAHYDDGLINRHSQLRIDPEHFCFWRYI